MKALARIAATIVAVPPMMAAGQSSGADAVLQAVRAALGGEAALSAVTSLAVSGSLSRSSNDRTLNFTVDYKSAFPDRFVRVMRQSTPMNEISTYTGFNGDQTISGQIFNPPVALPEIPGPSTPEGKAAQRVKQLDGARRTMAEFQLPLFASSPTAYPLTFALGPRESVAGHDADVVIVTGPDTKSWRFVIDATTHLPVRLIWRGRPVAHGPVVSMVTATTTRGGKIISESPTVMTAPPMPIGDPTAGLPDVEWITVFDQYKKSNGLTWPHHVMTTVDGKKYEDDRLGPYKINPRFGDDTFSPIKVSLTSSPRSHP